MNTPIYARVVAADPTITVTHLKNRIHALATAHTPVKALFVMLPFTAPVGVTPTLALAHARSVDLKRDPIEAGVACLHTLMEANLGIDLYLESPLNLVAKPGLTPRLADTLAHLKREAPCLKGLFINDLPLGMRQTDPLIKDTCQASPLPLLMSTSASLDQKRQAYVAHVASALTPNLPLLVDPTPGPGSLHVIKSVFQGPLVGTLMSTAALQSTAASALRHVPVDAFMVMDALYE